MHNPFRREDNIFADTLTDGPPFADFGDVADAVHHDRRSAWNQRHQPSQFHQPSQSHQPSQPHPNTPATGVHNLDPLSVLAELLADDGFAPVTWHISRAMPHRIDGSLLLSTTAELQIMDPQRARDLLNRFAWFIGDGYRPAPTTSEPEGHRTRVMVSGIRRGIAVNLSAIMDQLTSPVLPDPPEPDEPDPSDDPDRADDPDGVPDAEPAEPDEDPEETVPGAEPERERESVGAA